MLFQERYWHVTLQYFCFTCKTKVAYDITPILFAFAFYEASEQSGCQ